MKHKQKEALSVIRRYLLDEGVSPSIRDIQRELGYQSPRSAALILASLMSEGYVDRTKDGNLRIIQQFDDPNESARTKKVPVVGSVACGTPILAEENIESYIPVSTQIARAPYNYFFLRAKGDSMNEKNINDGDLVLVKQQDVPRKGELVIALVNDEATIKEFCKEGDVVILKPHSTNSNHKPIVLSENFRIQGVAVASFSNL